MSAQISNEVKALARQEWFPIFMRELGYEVVVRCEKCVFHNECRYEQYLGLKGFCSKGERRADENG